MYEIMLAAIFNISTQSLCLYCDILKSNRQNDWLSSFNKVLDRRYLWQTKTNSCRLYPLNSDTIMRFVWLTKCNIPLQNSLTNNKSWKKCQNWIENNKLKEILWQSGYVGYVPAAIRWQTDSPFKILVAYKQYWLVVGFHAVFINFYSNQHDNIGAIKI